MDIETFSDLEVQDINLYYQDTFVRFKNVHKGNEKLEWFYICRCNPDKSMEISDEAEHHYTVMPAKKIGYMDFDMPESGIYPYKSSVVYVKKIPRRQNKKAVCCETYSFAPFQSVFTGTKFASMFPSSYGGFKLQLSNVQRLFETEKYKESLHAAWIQVKKQAAICEPIDRNFSVSSGIYDKFPVLWYRFIPVGTMKSSDVIVVQNKLFLQEVVDRFSFEAAVKIHLQD